VNPVLKLFYNILDRKRDFWHKEFQTQLDGRPACTDVNTETSKYGPSCRCSQILLLCSLQIKSRAEGDPETSQLAREKSLQAWMHSNATPRQSPGCSSFTTSGAEHITLNRTNLQLKCFASGLISSFPLITALLLLPMAKIPEGGLLLATRAFQCATSYTTSRWVSALPFHLSGQSMALTLLHHHHPSLVSALQCS